MHALDLRPGVDPELAREPVPQSLVHGQGVGLPAGGRQGAHQLTGQPLAQGVGGQQVLELGDGLLGPPEPEPGLQPVDLRVQPQLVQPDPDGAAYEPSAASTSGSPRQRASALARCSGAPPGRCSVQLGTCS